MYFHKIHDPINFSFPRRFEPRSGRLEVGGQTLGVSFDELGADVFRWRLTGPRWPHRDSQAELTAPGAGEGVAPSRARALLGPRAELELFDGDGASLLRSAGLLSMTSPVSHGGS